MPRYLIERTYADGLQIPLTQEGALLCQRGGPFMLPFLTSSGYHPRAGQDHLWGQMCTGLVE
jgi:hypothetical protein